jgi:hypothetical protein
MAQHAAEEFAQTVPAAEYVETVEANTPVPTVRIEPGALGFDWQVEYPDEPVFVFTASDGTTVGIPALTGERKPRSGFLRKLRKENAMEQMWSILELVMSPAALAVSDEFGDEDYAAMYTEWAQWSRTTAGESLR